MKLHLTTSQRETLIQELSNGIPLRATLLRAACNEWAEQDAAEALRKKLSGDVDNQVTVK